MTIYVYLMYDPDTAELIREDSRFLVQLRGYVDLGIEKPEVLSDACFTFFLDVVGMKLPAIGWHLRRKPGHEDDVIEDYASDDLPPFERSIQGFLEGGDIVYDDPIVEYSCETVDDACIASLHFLITNGFLIRKCRNCGKYFIAYNRSDTFYCERMSPYNTSRTCRQDGAIRAYSASMSEDELRHLIRNTTTARRMRVHRNPDDTVMAAELTEWLDQLREKRRQYKTGDITEDEFIAWLEDTKRYRAKEKPHGNP